MVSVPIFVILSPLMSKTILIVAGESSGDLHGANLVSCIKNKSPDIRIIGAGGEKMRTAGVELVDDSTKYAAVGPFEAFAKFGRFAKLNRQLISTIRTAKPDLAVLID